LETRTTHPGRTRLLYFVPLVPLVMGLVLIAIDEANLFPWDQSHPSSNVGYYLWTGGLFFLLLGLIGSMLALVAYNSLSRAASASRQSKQDADHSAQERDETESP
jgi:hypothetical protein